MATITANTKVTDFVSNIANENLPCWEKFSEERRRAKEILNSLDFPTTKNEYWKYTRLGKIVNNTYTLGQPDKIDITNFLIPNLEIPSMETNQSILEVKYDHFLPEFIQDIIQLGNIQQSAASKYAACRIYQ